jgi:hypothetical protein
MAEPRDPVPALPRAEDEAAQSDRRAFLRRAAGEVAAGAGRLIELSNVAQRSAAAARATLAATGSLRPTLEGPPAAASSSPGPDGRASEVQASIAVPVATPPRAPTLSADEQSFLAAAMSAAIAVNDVSGAPQLTASWFHWDGTMFRLPTGLLSAKAASIGRDPRVSLLVGDVDKGWVAVAGHAEMISGPAAQVQAQGILEKYRPGVDPEAAWADINEAGDTVIVVVSPSRFVWRVP